MIFCHRITKKPALWITPYDPSWKNTDSPYLFRVRSVEDLPFTRDMAHIYEQIDVAESIWRLQGRFGFYAYLRGFFMNDWCVAKERGASRKELKKIREKAIKAERDFWFMFLPCGFPNGVLE